MTDLVWLRERGMGASILVAALSSAFGVVLIAATGYLGAILLADRFIGGGEKPAGSVAHTTGPSVGGAGSSAPAVVRPT